MEVLPSLPRLHVLRLRNVERRRNVGDGICAAARNGAQSTTQRTLAEVRRCCVFRTPNRRTGNAKCRRRSLSSAVHTFSSSAAPAAAATAVTAEATMRS